MDFKPFKIGKYLLMERLATGGMAEVYRAKASGAGGFEKQLAIKRILPNYSQNEEFQRMFEYEARLSSMLTHANIVQVYDFVKSGETYLLALEYVDGKNLRQFVNKIRKTGYMPPIEFSVWIMNEVCKGLEYAHKKKDDITGRPLNIIHRDMSPQNIMLSYDGAVKIVDFGIAKAKDRVDETRSGVIKGKFGYMSPEQANGQPVDHRTDIFSTAIITWEMLTGKRLFAAENDMATLKLIQECVIPSPARSNPKVTPELEKLVIKGITKDLTLRYQSAGSMHRSLQEFLNKYYPSFTQKEAADVLSRTFAEEITTEKKRFEQIYRQSIPFSQGAQKKEQPEEEEAFDGIEEALDGSITRSESAEVTAVTSEEELSEGSLPSEDRSAGSTQAGGERLDRTMASSSLSLGDNTQVESVIGAEEFSMPSLNDKGRRDRDRDRNTNTNARAAGLIDNSPDSNSNSTLGDRTLIKEDRGRESSPRNSSTRNRPRPQGQDVPAESGIILGTSQDFNEIGRRRERSISAINDVSGSTAGGRGEISLVAMNETQGRRGSQNRNNDDEETSAPRKMNGAGGRYYPERDDYVQKRRIPTFISAVLLLGAIGGVVYLYQLYVDQKIPMLVQMIDPRGTTSTTKPEDQDTIPLNGGSATRGDCTVQIDSDPAGAAVVIGGTSRGNTSTTISLPCNQTFEYSLQIEGYEVATDRLQMKERMGKVYKTLAPIPLGKLELTTDRNAKIYIDDQLAGDVKAGEKFEKTLRANRKYRLRFYNEIFNIDVTREFTISPDRIEREVVRLVEPMGRTTNSRGK